MITKTPIDIFGKVITHEKYNCTSAVEKSRRVTTCRGDSPYTTDPI